MDVLQKSCNSILLVFGVLASVSCVSVKLPDGQTKRSNRAEFSAPSAPFQQFFPEHLDMAWQDNLGRSISFISECGLDERVSLKDIQSGLAKAVGNGRKISEVPLTIAGREGLRTIVEGEVDSKASTVDLVVFQDDTCTFILNYVSLRKHYQSGLEYFNSFLASFRIGK